VYGEGKGALPQKIARFSGDPCVGFEREGAVRRTVGDADRNGALDAYREVDIKKTSAKKGGVDKGIDRLRRFFVAPKGDEAVPYVAW